MAKRVVLHGTPRQSKRLQLVAEDVRAAVVVMAVEAGWRGDCKSQAADEGDGREDRGVDLAGSGLFS
jgi:hypothetical protein